jgi:ferredoxin-like protein FixX
MKTVLVTIMASLVTLGTAGAANITNSDSESHVLIVTEGSAKAEVIIDAGARIQICPAGCFITMPSGDRETLSGEETIEILNGAAVIK